MITTSAPEVAFFLRGQFGPEVVLARRAAAALVVAATVGAGTTLALAHGAGAVPRAGWISWGTVALVGATTGGAVALSSLAGQGRHRRVALVAVSAPGVAVAALLWAVRTGTIRPGEEVLTDLDERALLAGAAIVIGSTALLTSRLLRALDTDLVLSRQARWQDAGRSVLAGDQRAATLHLGQQPSRRDGRLTLSRSGARLILARDALGLRRARGRAGLSSVLAAVAAGVLASGSAPGGGLVVLASLVLFGCTAGWSQGLTAHVDHAEGSGLTPHSPQRLLVWHAVTPALVGTGMVLLAVATVATAGRASAAGATLAGATMALCTVTRVWVSSQTLLPVSAVLPLSTPAGDLSGVLVAAWFARGWLVVLGAALLVGGLGATASAAWTLACAAVIAVLTARTARLW